MVQPDLVLGGGLGGLVAALRLKQIRPQSEVVLIESSSNLGGALRGCTAMGADFDLGTHIPQQTGIPAIDGLLEQSVPEDLLRRMPSRIGDRSGTMNGANLCVESGFPDLLGSNPSIAGEVVAHVLAGVKVSESTAIRGTPVRDVAERWFGPRATRESVLPLVAKLFGPIDGLSGFALELANLTRVRAADEPTWMAHRHDSAFRGRIAFPDQARLPVEYSHSRMSLYPLRGGSGAFVAGLVGLCNEAGVRILNGHRVVALDPESRRVDLSTGPERVTLAYRSLLSTLGPLLTIQLLRGEAMPGSDRVRYRLVHHLADPAPTPDACYLYDHELASPIFRVTCYRAFSGMPDDVRLTTEVLGRDDIPDVALASTIERRLIEAGVLRVGSTVRSEVMGVRGGFPVPSVETFRNYAAAADALRRYEGPELVVTGVGSDGSAFFQGEVLRHVHASLNRLA